MPAGSPAYTEGGAQPRKEAPFGLDERCDVGGERTVKPYGDAEISGGGDGGDSLVMERDTEPGDEATLEDDGVGFGGREGELSCPAPLTD